MQMTLVCLDQHLYIQCKYYFENYINSIIVYKKCGNKYLLYIHKKINNK